MAAPAPAFSQLFKNVGAQGKAFDDPTPEDGQFYGFLSKADFNAKTHTWDVTFEVVNRRWMDNVLFSGPTRVLTTPPRAPALLFQIAGAKESELLAALGIATTDNLAEGSWYELTLLEGKGPVYGELYDPDIDLAR